MLCHICICLAQLDRQLPHTVFLVSLFFVNCKAVSPQIGEAYRAVDFTTKTRSVRLLGKMSVRFKATHCTLAETFHASRGVEDNHKIVFPPLQIFFSLFWVSIADDGCVPPTTTPKVNFPAITIFVPSFRPMLGVYCGLTWYIHCYSFPRSYWQRPAKRFLFWRLPLI